MIKLIGLIPILLLVNLTNADYNFDSIDNKTTIDMKLTPEQEKWFFTPEKDLSNDMLTKGADSAMPKWTQYYNRKTKTYKLPMLINTNTYKDHKLPTLWKNLLWARNQFKKHTNIRLIFIDHVDAKNTFNKGYINVFDKGSCWSYVGNLHASHNMKSQNMDIGWCYNYRGSILHEMLHALGFVHEHMRSDRNEFINVGSPNSANCAAYREGSLDTSGTEYDFDSILHYPVGRFSGCGITLKDPEKYKGKDIGQRRRFSELDIVEINAIYPKELL